jgi:hypothetical protein
VALFDHAEIVSSNMRQAIMIGEKCSDLVLEDASVAWAIRRANINAPSAPNLGRTQTLVAGRRYIA